MTHPIKNRGGPQIRQESVLQELVEKLLVLNSVYPLQEHNDALLVARNQSGGHV